MAPALDPQQLVGDVVRLGTVESVDLGAATCRVRIGAIVTGDLPWLAGRAGATRIWSPPSVGEQCLLLCAEGDAEAGLVLAGLFSDAHPAPASDARELIVFVDGTTVEYDAQAHALAIRIAAGGTLAIDAPGGATITGPVTIDGKLTVRDDVDVGATLTAQTDVVGAGKSLKGHRHTSVQAGAAVSGPPQ